MTPKQKMRLERFEMAKELVASGLSIVKASKQVGISAGTYRARIKKEPNRATPRHEVVPLLQDFDVDKEVEDTHLPLTLTITGSPRLVAQFLVEVRG